VLLARYLRISPEEAERTQSSLLARYLRLLAALLEKEGGLASRREDEYL
jgi:hypothetical protein